MLRKVSFIVVILLINSCATIPPESPPHQETGDYTYFKEYMSWYIKREMNDKNIVGLSVALVDDQKIIWQQGFGFADIKNRVAATPETVYRSGSISKVFNALATMKLVEAGKMDIDHPINTYLPEFSIKSRFGDTNTITPKTIMTHHSGLPSDWIDGMWSKNPKSFTQLVTEIRNEYVAYPSNTLMSYSNVGITLLGHAIQKVSDMEYSDFLEQALLTPMGMKNSRFETGISGNAVSKSYSDGEEVIEYSLRDIPAGGLNSTVVDLSRLVMMVNNGGRVSNHQILLPDTLNDMLAVQNKNIPLDLGNQMGLSWFINRNILPKNEPVYNHGGAVIAHRGMFMVAPESKLGVVLLANSAAADSQKIAKEALQRAWEVKFGKKIQEDVPTKNIASDFTGTYATDLGKVDIEEKKRDHYTVASPLGKLSLKPGDDNLFRLSYRLFGLIPIDLDELGDVSFYTENLSNYHTIVGEFEQRQMLVGVKVAPNTIHAEWKRRLGSYELLNPPEPAIFRPESIELKIEDEYLVSVVTNSGNSTTQILRTINAEEAIIEGLGRGFGETIRIERDNQEEILSHSGLRYRLIQ